MPRPPWSVGESCDQDLDVCVSCYHRATAYSTSSDIAELSHPLADGDPDAVLHVTQNFNPGGVIGAENNSSMGVTYSGSN